MNHATTITRDYDDVLRLQTPGNRAMDFALILLGFLEGELDAEVESTGSEPVLIQLEDLQVELAIDGSDVTVRRMSGSAGEFGDLCDLIVSQYSLS